MNLTTLAIDFTEFNMFGGINADKEPTLVLKQATITTCAATDSEIYYTIKMTVFGLKPISCTALQSVIKSQFLEEECF